LEDQDLLELLLKMRQIVFLFCFWLMLEFVVQIHGEESFGIETEQSEDKIAVESRQKRGILQKILFLNAFGNFQIPFLG